MTRPIVHIVASALRIVSLIVAAALGTIALMRFAPGYFTDAREMDATYAEAARAALKAQEDRQGSMFTLTKDLLHQWTRGDLGESKQYGVPVTDLIKPRIRTTATLLASGILCGWSAALVLALPLSLRRKDSGEATIKLSTCLLLAVPIGAMATACLLTGKGGPLAVLSIILLVRDFKLVYKLLRQTRQAPQLLYARAQGIPGYRITWLYLMPPLARELLTLGMISLVTALSAIVPVEVIFDVPGLGQLAWSGAMNRDLPVLLGVTLLMAATVGIAGTLAGTGRQAAAQ